MFSPDPTGVNHKKHEIHYYPPSTPPTHLHHDVLSYRLPPSVVSAACVDVYGTHSNVHLGRFHTGKITRRCRPVTSPITPPPMPNLSAPPAAVIAIVRSSFTIVSCLGENCVCLYLRLMSTIYTFSISPFSSKS